MVPVPVRLPADLHTRLREWSAEHGFSMATVVRGLVSRFLESQEPPGRRPEPEMFGEAGHVVRTEPCPATGRGRHRG